MFGLLEEKIPGRAAGPEIHAHFYWHFAFLECGTSQMAALDGQKILSYFTSSKVDRFMAQYQNYIAIAFMILVVTGVLDTPIGWLQNGMFWIMDKLTFWVDPILKAIFLK